MCTHAHLIYERKVSSMIIPNSNNTNKDLTVGEQNSVTHEDKIVTNSKVEHKPLADRNKNIGEHTSAARDDHS